MKIVTVYGARPQFIKAAPISEAIAAHNREVGGSQARMEEVCVHTGQHYDQAMSAAFFATLGLRDPDYNLEVGSGSHGWQLGEMMKRLEPILLEQTPDAVLVYGDTNSTLAAALMASRLHIPVAHVEAGMRSFDRRMPEETNRILTDHLSSLLFVPAGVGVRNLCKEGITRGVYLVGNVMFEAARRHLRIAEKSSDVLQRLRLAPKQFALVTVHRAENTDDVERLKEIVSALAQISRTLPVVWPVHPRATANVRDLAKTLPETSRLQLIEPAGYLDMLLLEKNARVILTDSGGVQEEAMWAQVPCVTLRHETEWVETVELGWNQLGGTSKDSILTAFERALESRPAAAVVSITAVSASKQIVEHLSRFLRERARASGAPCVSSS
jgi:UDP-N-acetylglucosamine 2-epimerase